MSSQSNEAKISTPREQPVTIKINLVDDGDIPSCQTTPDVDIHERTSPERASKSPAPSSLSSEERAQRVFATVGRGVHPDEGLVALADLLDIEYRPSWWGREAHFDIDRVWERI